MSQVQGLSKRHSILFNWSVTWVKFRVSPNPRVCKYESHSTSILAELGPAQPQLVFQFFNFSKLNLHFVWLICLTIKRRCVEQIKVHFNWWDRVFLQKWNKKTLDEFWKLVLDDFKREIREKVREKSSIEHDVWNSMDMWNLMEFIIGFYRFDILVVMLLLCICVFTL